MAARKKNDDVKFNFTPTLSREEMSSITWAKQKAPEENKNLSALEPKVCPTSNRSLLHAVYEHDTVAVEELLKPDSGGFGDSWREELNASLVLAVTEKQLNLVKLLIDAGADAHTKNRGYPLTNVALDMKEQEIFDVLFEHGSDHPEFRSMLIQPNGTLLHSAIRSGCLDTVKRVCEVFQKNNLPLDSTEEPNGNTPLHVAVNCTPLVKETRVWFSEENLRKARRKRKALALGNWPLHTPSRIQSDVYSKRNYTVLSHSLDIIKHLLQCGVNVNARNKLGRTPLHEAVACGIKEQIRLLLEHGADATALDSTDHMPWMQFVVLNKKGILALLADKTHPAALGYNYKGKSILHHACSAGCIESIKILLRKGMDPAMLSENGWTTLMEAASTKETACVDYLLQNTGVDVKYTVNGESALTLLLQNQVYFYESGTKTLNNLLKAGADLNDRHAHNPLVTSLDNDNTRSWLLQNGADVNIILESGLSMICIICQKNQQTAISLVNNLMEYNLDMRLSDHINPNNGETPLIHALKAGFPDLCTLFLNSGCSCRNSKNWLQTDNGKDLLRNIPDHMQSIVDRIQMSQVQSLIDITRQTVLCSLKPGKLVTNVQSLPLPKTLISYMQWPVFLEGKEQC